MIIFLYKSLDHAKKDILNTLINISNKFNRFKANIMLEVDDITLSSYPLEVRKYAICNTFNSLNSKKVHIVLIYIPAIMFINT